VRPYPRAPAKYWNWQRRGEITITQIEESTGANRNTIKVHWRKLASDRSLQQVGKGRRAWYTLK
jgi:Fic family protein